MSELLNLYRTGPTGTIKYWYRGPAECSHCKEEIDLLGFSIRWWERGQLREDLLCPQCTREKPPLLPSKPWQQRIQFVVFTEEPPRGAVCVLPYRQEFKAGRMNLFDAADESRLPSDTIIDKTRLSGRGSWGGAVIGKSVEELEDLRK